jgi:hypothetical protein
VSRLDGSMVREARLRASPARTFFLAQPFHITGPPNGPHRCALRTVTIAVTDRAPMFMIATRPATPMENDYLILRRASASRPSGEWSSVDYDVLANGEVVGRIFKANPAPVGTHGCGPSSMLRRARGLWPSLKAGGGSN